MDAHDAYSILETIATLSSSKNNLYLVEPTTNDLKNEDEATEIRFKKKVSKLPKMKWLIEQNIVHIGDEIYVLNHPEEIAIIVSPDNVNYNGEIMSFNQFGCKITGRKSIQCYAWMKIKDQNDTLFDLREK